MSHSLLGRSPFKFSGPDGAPRRASRMVPVMLEERAPTREAPASQLVSDVGRQRRKANRVTPRPDHIPRISWCIQATERLFRVIGTPLKLSRARFVRGAAGTFLTRPAANAL